jgi:hypothetical protein
MGCFSLASPTTENVTTMELGMTPFGKQRTSLHYSSALESDRTVVGIESERQEERQIWG